MQKLRKMYIYKSIHNHFIIPYKEITNSWLCQTFRYDKETNTVIDEGYFFYEKDGTCYGVKKRNVHQMIALYNLHPKIRKVIKEWKTEYKRTYKDV